MSNADAKFARVRRCRVFVDGFARLQASHIVVIHQLAFYFDGERIEVKCIAPNKAHRDGFRRPRRVVE